MSSPEFDIALQRYFDGDLDRVEMRAFEAGLESSPEQRDTFAKSYDARTAGAGLLALSARDGELAECFSAATLERYSRGELDEEDRATVDAHLACSWCSGALRELAASRVVPISTRPSWRKWTARATAGAAAAAAAAFIVIRVQPHDGDPPALNTRLAISLSSDGTVQSRGAPAVERDDIARTAHLGETLNMRVRTSSTGFVELRVYLADIGLMLRCPGDQRCTVGQGEIAAQLKLDSRGLYRVVRLGAQAPLPESKGSLELDLAEPEGLEVDLREVYVN